MQTESSLVHTTRKLLLHRDRTITIQRIARDTGLHFRFIESFAYKRSEDYGVNRVTVLYEYLSGKKLDVV